MQTQLSFAHFLESADFVARSVLVILIVMSLSSWTVIVARAWREFVQARLNRRFLSSFWHAPSLQAAEEVAHGPEARSPFANVARHGFAAVAGLEADQRDALKAHQNQEGEALIRRMLERGIAQGRRAAEFGLGVLASVASSAPFVGLFGTVWGVYQALIRIGQTGQGTLDKVAGPIGEALIMTGIGLAVAIPAVIGYNAFARRSRHLSADLNSFAGDVMALLTSGFKAPQLLAGDLDAAVARAAPPKPVSLHQSAAPTARSADAAAGANRPIGRAALDANTGGA